MSITQPDLKYFKAEEQSSAATNGGLMSMLTTDELVTGSKNNLWPNVSYDDRTAGITLYRKLFGVPHSDTNDDLVDPRVWNHSPTSGDDYLILFAGTKTDTEAAISESTFYSCGALKTNIASGVSSLVVTVENAAQTAGFHALGKVRISNQASPEASGDWEDIALNATPPGVSSLEVTLYFATNTVNAYLASNTVVSALYQPGTTSVSTGTVVVTSTSGTVDESGFPIEVNNTGTIDESVAVTWSTPTAFSVVGSRSGALGSGTISTDFTGLHPNNGKTLIFFPAGFFSASGWLALDTVVVPTIANNIPVWLKRVVPALSGDLSGNYNITGLRGESA